MFPSATFRNLPAEMMWETVTVEKGDSFEGIIVGKCVEVDCHFDRGADRACRAWATNGKLPCLLCDKFQRTLVRGYLPCLTKLRERRVVLLSESVVLKVRGLAQGTPVRFSRPKKGKRAVVLTLLSNTDLGERFTAQMRETLPVEIFGYLLHLWQIPELNAHFGMTYFPARRPIPDEPAPPGEAAA